MQPVDVRLRPVREQDWPAVHDWARLPESCRYQEWGPNTPGETEQWAHDAAREWLRRPQVRFPYAILLGDEVVGTAELHLRGGGQGEIGYGVHPRHWGHGIATAAASLLLGIGFERHGLHRVFATCDPRNVGSGRVLAKIGMTHEGRLRETMLIRDGWRDSDLYAILVHDPRPVIPPG